MIATRDIAAFAARALAARDWTGFEVQELLGPRDLSFAEATRILGAAIGKPDLAYVQFPYADYSAALQQAGLSKSVADLYAEMEKAFDDGIVNVGRGPQRGEHDADDVRAVRAPRSSRRPTPRNGLTSRGRDVRRRTLEC